MAKPDMSRNKDLAGKTVSKGGYNISYNENGYATSAIKTGSKTGKAAAPSADTVGGGGSDRGSYGGSVYDQEHFSNDELRSAAEVRAAAAAGKTTWADAHDYVERIRSNYGYSGDSDGSRYIPLEMGGGGRGNGGGGFSYEAAPTYTAKSLTGRRSATTRRRTPPISSIRRATRAAASGRCRTPWGRSAPAQAALQAAMRAAQRSRPMTTTWGRLPIKSRS